MNGVEMDDLVDTNICINWIRLDQVGALWKGSEISEGKIWYHRKRSNRERHECLDKDNAQVAKSLRFNKMFLVMIYGFLCCTFLVIFRLTKKDKKIRKFSHSLPTIIDLLIKNCIPPPTYA